MNTAMFPKNYLWALKFQVHVIFTYLKILFFSILLLFQKCKNHAGGVSYFVNHDLRIVLSNLILPSVPRQKGFFLAAVKEIRPWCKKWISFHSALDLGKRPYSKLLKYYFSNLELQIDEGTESQFVASTSRMNGGDFGNPENQTSGSSPKLFSYRSKITGTQRRKATWPR